MEFRLNELQETIRASAREYAHTYLRPRIDEIEHAEKFPQDLIDVMADMGFIGLSYPEAYGGLDAGYLCEAIAIEEISKVSPSAGKLLTVCLLPLDAIHLFGTEMQKMKYLPDGISGKDIGSLAFTEPGTGSDPKQLTTTAKRVGDKYIINATKRFISNAAHEGHIVVVARDENADTCTAYIVKKFCKGYSISTPWEKIGFHGSHVYDVFFDDVEVGEEDILGGYGKGFDLLIGTTTYGKLAFSAVFAGAMEGAYELAVKYTQEKLHRGTSIGKFATNQLRISEIAANTLSAQLMLYRAASDADSITGDIRRVQAITALAKGYIADLATRTIQMALNAHGSYGVTKEYSVERFLRDAAIFPNIEGAADVQRLISGNYILRRSDSLL